MKEPSPLICMDAVDFATETASFWWDVITLRHPRWTAVVKAAATYAWFCLIFQGLMISSLSVMSRWCFLASFLVRYHLRMHWQRIWKTLEKVYLLPRKAASDVSLWSSENFPEHKQLLAVIREWVNWRECGAVLLEPPSRFEEMQETTLLGAVISRLEISRWWSEPKFSSFFWWVKFANKILELQERSFAQVDVSGVYTRL